MLKKMFVVLVILLGLHSCAYIGRNTITEPVVTARPTEHIVVRNQITMVCPSYKETVYVEWRWDILREGTGITMLRRWISVDHDVAVIHIGERTWTGEAGCSLDVQEGEWTFPLANHNLTATSTPTAPFPK